MSEEHNSIVGVSLFSGILAAITAVFTVGILVGIEWYPRGFMLISTFNSFFIGVVGTLSFLIPLMLLAPHRTDFFEGIRPILFMISIIAAIGTTILTHELSGPFLWDIEVKLK